MADQPSNVSAAISLPKGGGAIRGIGETFQPNMFSGTGNFGVPIITSQGRDGFAPTLAIHYSSGNGNGPFGLGWQLSIPRIARKTEKGLPTYTDDDVFVISGSEDLVPWMTPAADNLDRWEAVLETCGEYTIAVYRPRTEGGFVRIQKWTHANGDVHWRAVTPENVTSIYGRTTAARVSDPDDADRVFEWLLEETFDARGNHVFYEYVRENPDLQLPGVSEQNRSYAQVFIRRILYGNTPDALEPTRRVGPTRIATDHRKPLETRERHYVFEVLFDYGDLTWPLAIPTELPQEPAGLIPGDWPVRPDPFSTFRAGFELRSLRLCERVLMLHHFDEPGMRGAPLVKSTDFTYDVDPRARLSLLTAVTVSGYREDSDAPQQYFQRSLPPVAFKYTTFEPRQQRYQSIQAARGDLPPRGLSAPELTVVDLFGDGLPDILQADATGFTYWRNRGEGRVDDGRALPGEQPAHSFAQANVAIADLGGDGLADLVVNTPAASGFYESTPEGRWRTFQPFEAVPAVDLGDPNARFVDLTGDGLSDILVTRDDQFVWYPCLGESGYDAPRAVPRRHDQAAFPDVFFDDPTGRVRLADMSGDGLSDIVLVHDGRIDYWPNLGYGHFGPRLTMANAPHIGYGFDPKRLFLVDLDGSGCADLVYVDVDCVHLWLNQSGNGWSEPDTIRGTPRVTDVTDLRFSDFFGTGTSTLLWSDDRGTTNDPHYKALDFCGGRKPHLLLEMDNNMGTTTRVQYAASTKFCLEDAARGTPWITSLPFPVHVVEKTEVIDRVSRTKLVTTYRYHHGYYDGREREFRGFGRVDQCDTEFFEDFVGAGLHEPDLRFDNGKKNFHTAPVETRTWFHTGIWFGADTDLDYRSLEERYRREYYDGDSDAFSLGDHEATPAASDEDPGSLHDAYRALRGAVLRAEVYGRDDSGNAGHPYSVSQTRYAVKALQPRGANRHGVYIVSRREGITNAYERHPADPRVTATLEGEPDEYGNVSDAVTIAYPRRVPSPEVPEQAELHIVYNRTDFLNRHHHQTTEDAGFYYARIPFQTRSYEVTGKLWQPGDPPLTQSSLADLFDTTPAVEPASFMPYEWEPEPDRTDVARRIIEWTRKYFRSDAAPDRIDAIGELEHRLLLGEIQSLGLPYEEYRATFTESHVRSVYGDRIADVDLPGEGGYHPHANHPGAEGEEDLKEYWWTPSGRQGFDPATFYSARRSQDPFGNVTTRELDRYGLATASIRDALPAPQTNVISARQDYRVLQPWEVTDANGNRAQVAFDVFGFVSGTAVM